MLGMWEMRGSEECSRALMEYAREKAFDLSLLLRGQGKSDPRAVRLQRGRQARC